MLRILIAALALVTTAAAQTNVSNVAPVDSLIAPKNGGKVRVKIQIGPTDDGSEDVVRSYITRELRQINDVLIVDEKNFITIDCIVTPNKTQDGHLLGYTVSYAVTSQALNIMTLGSLNGDSDSIKFVKQIHDNRGILVDHFTHAMSVKDMDSCIKEDVAQIDGKDFEDFRAIFFRQK